MKPIFVVSALAAVAACTTTDSSADAINRPGAWHASFQTIVTDSTTWATTFQPAPDYPDRTITTPTVDSSGCTAGCSCEWSDASEECDGDPFESCKALGAFKETCADHISGHPIVFDCLEITFDTDSHGTGVCVHDHNDTELGRYWLTIVRASY